MLVNSVRDSKSERVCCIKSKNTGKWSVWRCKDHKVERISEFPTGEEAEAFATGYRDARDRKPGWLTLSKAIADVKSIINFAEHYNNNTILAYATLIADKIKKDYQS